MKKIFFFIAISMLSGIALNAQNIEFTPIAGYNMNGSIKSYYGHYDMKNDLVYGGIMNIEIEDMTFLELSYRRSTPKVVNYSATIFESANFRMGMEHYHIGVLRELMDDEKVKPFGNFTVGASRYFEHGVYDQERWSFSANIGLGVKFFFGDVVGLRIHSNLMMPMQMDGVGLMCGFGSGGGSCGGGATFNVPIVHFEVGGGLIFRLSN